MDKIKNLSVRKTIILYMLISLIGSFLLSAVIVEIASHTQEQIWWKYVDQDKYFEAVEGEAAQGIEEVPYYKVDIPRPSASDMSRIDHGISELCDFLQTYTILLLSAAGSCAAVFLFYRHKLKPPIEELKRALNRIAGNNLDFHISYENEDEINGMSVSGI